MIEIFYILIRIIKKYFMDNLKLDMNNVDTVSLLEQVPIDLMLLITSYLSSKDVRMLCQISSQFNSKVCQNKSVILMLFARNLTSNLDRLKILRSKSVKELQQLYYDAFTLNLRNIAQNGYEKLLESRLRDKDFTEKYQDDILIGSILGDHLDIVESYLTQYSGSPNPDAYYISGRYNKRDILKWLVQSTFQDNIYQLSDYVIQTYMYKLISGIIAGDHFDLLQWLFGQYPDLNMYSDIMYIATMHDKLDIIEWIYKLKPTHPFNWKLVESIAVLNEYKDIVDWLEQNHLI